MSTQNETRDLELPSELCTRVSHWHGGQFTPTYALCSTGSHDYVSIDMIQAAIDELEGPGGKFDTPELKADREDLAGELHAVIIFASEHRREE